ncbi:hypothetical protein [Acinetobacter indicus]|uniref:Uncharacterized protein n=1 Tax=Acinetobacter indicus TaxID=756892 RepID=A0A6C0Y0R6_9GAMM|nr:hypothetical protein [Acinetobacter indicus]QIC69794.1 hypothetical protein FSC09_04950 [Acinetobacter indicus]
MSNMQRITIVDKFKNPVEAHFDLNDVDMRSLEIAQKTKDWSNFQFPPKLQLRDIELNLKHGRTYMDEYGDEYTVTLVDPK